MNAKQKVIDTEIRPTDKQNAILPRGKAVRAEF